MTAAPHCRPIGPSSHFYQEGRTFRLGNYSCANSVVTGILVPSVFAAIRFRLRSYRVLSNIRVHDLNVEAAYRVKYLLGYVIFRPEFSCTDGLQPKAAITSHNAGFSTRLFRMHGIHTFERTLAYITRRSERVKQFADDIIECYQRASNVPSSGRFESLYVPLAV